ncbi:MAG: aspartate aminotransferase family protein [Actinobacteria bacterium]|nr:aspartate aminotransferase family protein [Actinomycetota bacterium]MBO0787881.1 aspartate aminotransferase family protein [Actinomycetota bacterium]
MDPRAFGERLVAQRERLHASPAELLERVEASGYGPRSKEILREHVRTESTGQVGFALFGCPPAIVRGEGALVWDADGKEYVDLLAGFSVSNLGHCHPAVTAAVSAQAGRLLHYFDLPGEQRERLAARLAGLAPGDRRRRVVFGTTGADAAELAIRLARWYTGAPIILSGYGGYHGTTGATMATTAKGGMWAFHYPVLPADSGHAKIPYSYPYRCPVGAPPEHCAEACLEFTRRMLLGKESPFTEHRAGVSNVAAVLLEPMQASAGYIIPGDGYLRGMRELCDEFGFLLIDDEIQAGMGRTGRMWACDHEQVVPDLMLVSKGLASGLPVSAVIADDEIAASWGPGAHVGTFAATALACAAANATLDVYEAEGLAGRAAETGDYFADQLRALQARHPILGWVDARGLFLGLEFVRDRITKEPAAEEAGWMLDFCVREGLLFEKGGYYYNRFQLIPSLVIDKELVDRAVGILDRAMTMAEARSGITAGR